MASTFMDPGGDADFGVSFWPNQVGSPAVATDFVHGTHIKSIKFAVSSFEYLLASSTVSDAGGRISVWVYINALPSSTKSLLFALEQTNDGTPTVALQVDSSGNLQLFNSSHAAVASGSTPTTAGAWHRITLAWTITSSSVNALKLFLDGSQIVSVTNVSLPTITSKDVLIGNGSGTDIDFRISDYYSDNSTSLTDTGNVWVTAKRPFTNGTTNGFTTKVGSGGSGYGSGHTPQVNERPISTANGWSVVAAGSAITEEYNIESVSQGDIDITGATIIDYEGWVINKALLAETGKIIVNGVQTSISITTGNSLFTAFAGSSSYPAGSGSDIGMVTATTATTVTLWECGIIVAFIPSSGGGGSVNRGYLNLLGVGV